MTDLCQKCGQVPRGVTHVCPPLGTATSTPGYTTTTDTRYGVLIRLIRDHPDSHYIASDLTGLRFGSGRTPVEALTEWWSQVSDILSMKDEELGDPLLSEVRAYREALS